MNGESLVRRKEDGRSIYTSSGGNVLTDAVVTPITITGTYMERIANSGGRLVASRLVKCVANRDSAVTFTQLSPHIRMLLVFVENNGESKNYIEYRAAERSVIFSNEYASGEEEGLEERPDLRRAG